MPRPILDGFKPSEVITAYVDWLTAKKTEQEYCWSIVTKEDDKVQDFLHEMEFCEDPEKRIEIADRLHQSRNERRHAKDQSKALKPIKDYMDDATCKAHVKRINRLIKELQAVEEFLQSDRVYKPRVSDENETEDTSNIYYAEAKKAMLPEDYAEVEDIDDAIEYADTADVSD